MPANCNALSTTGAPQATSTVGNTPTPTPTSSGPTIPQYGQCGGTGVSHPIKPSRTILNKTFSGPVEPSARPAAPAQSSTAGTLSACNLQARLHVIAFGASDSYSSVLSILFFHSLFNAPRISANKLPVRSSRPFPNIGYVLF